MSAAKQPRAKAPAIAVPQSIEEASALLAEYGQHANEIVRINADLKEATAVIKKEAEAMVAPHQEELKAIFAQLQAFGAARRTELLNGKGKTVKLATGEMGWRDDPPSVKLTGKGKEAEKVAVVVAWLKAARSMVFRRFLRVKWEINREALLDNPEKAAEVPGIAIVTGVEQFWVAPAGLELAEVSP